MSMNRNTANRAAATAVAADARALVVVLVNTVLLGLALILSPGAEWIRAN